MKDYPLLHTAQVLSYLLMRMDCCNFLVASVTDFKFSLQNSRLIFQVFPYYPTVVKTQKVPSKMYGTVQNWVDHMAKQYTSMKNSIQTDHTPCLEFPNIVVHNLSSSKVHKYHRHFVSLSAITNLHSETPSLQCCCSIFAICQIKLKWPLIISILKLENHY